ncbi:MAG: DUF5011 domain-containing protein [Bacillota bacterium]|nr:DUF5011 domain-containing protein [Bacillota bacterium]
MKKYNLFFICILILAALLSLNAVLKANTPAQNSQNTNNNIVATVVVTTPTNLNSHVQITLNQSSISLEQGKSVLLTAVTSPSDALNRLVWKSSDQNIATVDSGGRIDGLQPGSCSITAAVDNTIVSCDLQVTAKDTSATSPTETTTATFGNQDTLAKNLKNSDKNPYLIKVNREQNVVTAYTYNQDGKYTIPVRAMVCSTGDNTPDGTYTTGYHQKWNYLFGDVWGQYATGITGEILFHSVPYKKSSPDSLVASYYNQLGTTASMGCVRMAVADVKWVYDNCQEGTTVVIYEDSNPTPLQKPTPIKVPDNDTWDPTDTSNSNNPWNSCKPSLLGTDDIVLSKNASFNIMQNVSAKDTCGNDITGKITVLGNVNVYKPGTYKLTYSVIDVLGRTAQSDRIVTVKNS